MLISPSRRIIFVHIQKTGGETVAQILRSALPDIQELGPKHCFAAYGAGRVEAWDSYYKFAFVRNPWDRLVSWYAMIQDARHTQWHEAARNRRRLSHFYQARTNPLWRYVYREAPTFESFIKNGTAEIAVAETVSYSFLHNQLDYVTAASGRLLVDRIGRFERFGEDLREILDRIGVDHRPAHENRSSHLHYSKYYDEVTRDIVARRFAKDIAAFGYRFEKADAALAAAS